MTSENQDTNEKPSSKNTVRLGYYGGTTSMGMLPRDTNWLKEILHLLHIIKDEPSDAQVEAKTGKNY